jgi:hypothetical protein
VCLREDDSPADVDPRDIEFEGCVTEMVENSNGATRGDDISSAGQGTAVGGAGAAVADEGKASVTSTASDAGTSRTHSAELVMTVARTAPGKFTASYHLSVAGSNSDAYQISISARVLGKVVRSPLLIAIRRILINRQVCTLC